MPEAALRVALLTHSLNPRGGVIHVLELGRALAGLGHRVTIVAPASPGQQPFRESPCELSIAPLAAAGGGLHDSVCARIEALRTHLETLLAACRFDVLHAHDGIGANALADLRARGLVPGYLRTVHHVDRFADPRVQQLEERSIRHASGVLCVSELWRTRLRAEFGIAAARVTNGVDLVRFAPERSPHDARLAARLGLHARPVVLSVGGIEARKNSAALLQAFVLLRNRLPQAQLVIAGGASLLDHGGEERRFAATAAAAGLTIGPGADIVPTGVLADADMPSLYRIADVLAMPSLIEGFGLAALEARACGVPAVVSAIEPFTEHFGERDVHWCDPRRPDSIAQALLAAAADTARERPEVCLRFDWQASARRHVELYREFVDRSNPLAQETNDARDALPAALAG